MFPLAERADYTVSFLSRLFARLFDLADFVAQLGRPLVLFAGDRLFHFPPQPNQLGLFLGAPGTELGHFADVARFCRELAGALAITGAGGAAPGQRR